MMDYIYIGKIVNTHGIKGELRIKSDFERKNIVFRPGFVLYIGKGYVPEKISSYRKHKDYDMVTFEGYNNINQVLNYKQMNVYAKREDLNLENSEYLLQDLIGLNVIENSESLGKVEEIVYNGSSILLYVEAVKNFYIPYNEEYIKKVNLDSRVIEVNGAKDLIL